MGLGLSIKEEEEKKQPTAPVIVEVAQSITPFLNTLLTKNAALLAEREAVNAVAEGTLATSQAANKSFNLSLKRVGQEFDAATVIGDRALNRLDALDQNPRFINNILGFFDPDFNRSIQERNLTRAQLGVSRAQSRLVTAEQRRQLTISTAKAEEQTVKQIFQFNRQGFLDTIAVAKAGFEIEDNIRKQTVEFATNQSVKSLERFLRNPSTVPSELKGKPGLIKTVLTSKRAAQLGVSAQEFNLSITKKAIERREFLNQFNSVEEIVNFKGTFPDGISQLDLNNRRKDFIEIEDAIETAKLAIQTKQITILNKQKAIILSRMGSLDLKEFEKEAISNNGQIDISGIPFRASEIRTALTETVKKEVEEERILAENTVAASGIIGSLAADDFINNQFAILYNPTSSVPTQDDIPIDVLSSIVNFDAQIENQKRRVDESIDEGSQTTDAAIKVLSEMLDKKQEFYKTQLEERVKNDFTDDVQPAVREYFITGRIGPENATTLTLTVGGNSSIFIDNDILDGPWASFAEVFPEVAAEKLTSISPAGEGLTAFSGKQRDSVILENAIKSSKFRQKVATNIQLLSMSMAVNQLAEELGIPSPVSQEVPGGELLSPNLSLNSFIKMVDPRTGRLATRFNSEDGSFDLTKFIQFAAEETLALQQTGILQPNETIAGIVFDRARNLSDTVIKQTFSGLYGTAVKSAVFGNRPQDVVLQAIDAAASLVPQSVLIAEQNTDALTKLTRDRSRVNALNKLGPGNITEEDLAVIMGDAPGFGRVRTKDFPKFTRPSILDTPDPSLRPRFGGRQP